MEETKPVQVVMLPTKDNTNMYHHKLSGKIGWTEVNLKIRHARISQHLYFISTDLIKKHDCYLESRYEREPFIDKADDSWEDDKTDPLFGKNPEGTFKVIASTDPSLGLPAIPLTWIRDEYVPSNGSIKEVRLETEPYLIRNGDNTLYYDIKLTPDNEVVIVDEPTLETLFPKEQCGDLLVDQELEDAANNYYDDEKHNRMGQESKYSRRDFKAGANWKAEQSANDAIEFAKWIIENYWLLDNKGMWYDRTKVHAGQQYDQSLTSQQLYELWQQSKKK